MADTGDLYIPSEPRPITHRDLVTAGRNISAAIHHCWDPSPSAVQDRLWGAARALNLDLPVPEAAIGTPSRVAFIASLHHIHEALIELISRRRLVTRKAGRLAMRTAADIQHAYQAITGER